MVVETSASTTKTNLALDVKSLRVYFDLHEGTLKAIDGVDFQLAHGQTLALIGESGSGKSVTARSILQLVPPPGRIAAGRIMLDRRQGGMVDVAQLQPNGREIRAIRGAEVAMVFQEPMTSLSPVHTIGNQIIEGIRLHRTPDRKQAYDIALDMVTKVGISNPAQRLNEYPHQLSGGMRQRVMIAMALACQPSILIADEPTTALDVTVQAQILELMRQLQQEFGMAMVYITHDLGVVAEIADAVNVMYLGRIVETASTKTLFKNPQHPYTLGLLKSVPKLGRRIEGDLDTIEGNVPVPLDMPPRCGFCGRCPREIKGRCDAAIPALTETEPGHAVRCFLYSDKQE